VRPFNPDKKARPDDLVGRGTEFDEASDTYDAIDWMIKNVPGNNKRVGVFGISYPGFYATMAALSGHPALKAVSPQAPVTDWFQGDDFHHNGAFFLMDAFHFYSGFGKPRPVPTQSSAQGFQFPSPDNYDFYLRTGALKNFTGIMGDSIAFWKDLMNHPNYDAWWKARNTRNFVTNIKPAMLIVGGLFDAEDCFGGWNLYKAFNQKAPLTETKLVEGPWFHGGWTRSDGTFLGNVRFGKKTSEYYQRNIEIPFFEFYLRLKGTVSGIAGANVFFTGEDKWRKFSQWPAPNSIPRNAYLLADGKISIEGVDAIKPVQENDRPAAYDEYISDPAHPVPYTEDVHLDRTREYMTDDQRFASRRTDVLTYRTGKLEGDLTIGGPVLADLFTSISTTDADFVVKLIDVFPDDFKYDPNYGNGNGKDYPMGGYQMLVRGEIMRGKFRGSFENPEAFIPGKITEVKFNLPDIAHTFKKGHELMIQIQSSWFPIADRNPQRFLDIYQANDSDFQKANVRIYHDAGAKSRIVLPMIIN
jgi:putative CocE/NonD family hydrolase